MISMMVQAVAFGAGALLDLAAPLAHAAATLPPAVIAASMLVSAAVAWRLAPLARARCAREINARACRSFNR
jgi:hypothetical protein